MKNYGFTKEEKETMCVLQKKLGESHEMLVAGVLRGGQKYNGFFYTMCGLEPRKIEIKKDWIIKDWTGNLCFQGEEFESFEDAEEFISERLGDDYEDARGEYEIQRKETRK